MTNLNAEEHLAGVLDVLLDLDEEGDGFPAIKKTVVVGEGEVHHGADLDLAVDGDGTLLDGVKTQDGGLGQVDDGGTVERTEDTTVGDGEGTASHVLNGELVVTSLLAELGDGLLDADHVHGLGVADDGGDETLLGGNGDGDVNVVAVNDSVTTVGALDGGVDGGEVLHGENGSAGEGGHEAKLDASLLEDLLLVLLAHVHQSRHVDLIKGGEGSGGVLRLLQALGDTQTHTVHLDLYQICQSKSLHLQKTCSSLTRRSSRLP